MATNFVSKSIAIAGQALPVGDALPGFGVVETGAGPLRILNDRKIVRTQTDLELVIQPQNVPANCAAAGGTFQFNIPQGIPGIIEQLTLEYTITVANGGGGNTTQLCNVLQWPQQEWIMCGPSQVQTIPDTVPVYMTAFLTNEQLTNVLAAGSCGATLPTNPGATVTWGAANTNTYTVLAPMLGTLFDAVPANLAFTPQWSINVQIRSGAAGGVAGGIQTSGTTAGTVTITNCVLHVTVHLLSSFEMQTQMADYAAGVDFWYINYTQQQFALSGANSGPTTFTNTLTSIGPNNVAYLIAAFRNAIAGGAGITTYYQNDTQTSTNTPTSTGNFTLLAGDGTPIMQQVSEYYVRYIMSAYNLPSQITTTTASPWYFFYHCDNALAAHHGDRNGSFPYTNQEQFNFTTTASPNLGSTCTLQLIAAVWSRIRLQSSPSTGTTVKYYNTA